MPAIPDNPCRVFAGTVLRTRVATEVPDAAVRARVAAEFGLDASPAEQYWRWLLAALRGDLGLSFVTRTPVAAMVLDALLVSSLPAALSLLLAAAAGIPAGVRAAHRPGGWADRLLTGGGVLGVSVPEFVLAPVLILVFAVWGGVLPAVGWGEPRHVVLPVLTMAVYPAALAAQLVRAETVEVLTRPHIRAARAHGLRPSWILWRHAARQGTVSVLSLSGMFVAGLIGGSVVVEVVYGVLGLGRLLYDAVLAQDLPVVQAATLVVLAIALAGGVLAEVVQLALDPVARDRG
ncbi:ABC transporter permease [Catenuloplanes atrovinosus]|uniref:Peptide/nickel transport system permease protein n=1 Tax=Catenuloplanes atrovinosus TaxID=137266 RepID=A0AAE3YML5_9ACTN|nr:ABC transporter permease [Catenuloplanes atrovinosus]MDR7276548.1 peptide/nickel transport system permease protein [Catenuloplanes atrovinosus]